MRKNFILVTFLFLFINILGFANEKSKDIDVISILDKEREASYFILNFSSFTESKEIMDYINTNINKKFSVSDLMNIFSGKEFPNITDTNSTAIKSLKKEILYNNILIFKTDYQNKKGITTIYENGKYRKIIYNYTDDLNGTVKEYDTNGKLISEFILKDGEVIEK